MLSQGSPPQITFATVFFNLHSTTNQIHRLTVSVNNTTTFSGSQIFPLLSRSRGREDERPWERGCTQYLFVFSEENVLPVHVIPARFVRQVAYISQFLFFKLSYNCRVKFREKFLVFHKWCFTTAAFSSLLQAEEDHLQKK